jgi:hypothetical protein
LVAGENLYENSFQLILILTKLRLLAISTEENISLEEENEKLNLVNTKINVNVKDDLVERNIRLF